MKERTKHATAVMTHEGNRLYAYKKGKVFILSGRNSSNG